MGSLSSTEVLDLVDRRISSGGEKASPRNGFTLQHSSVEERRRCLRSLAMTAQHISTQWRNGWRLTPPGRQPTTWSRKERALDQSLCQETSYALSEHHRLTKRSEKQSRELNFLKQISCKTLG